MTRVLTKKSSLLQKRNKTKNISIDHNLRQILSQINRDLEMIRKKKQNFYKKKKYRFFIIKLKIN